MVSSVAGSMTGKGTGVGGFDPFPPMECGLAVGYETLEEESWEDVPGAGYRVPGTGCQARRSTHPHSCFRAGVGALELSPFGTST
jgi:hypothetical protein